MVGRRTLVARMLVLGALALGACTSVPADPYGDRAGLHDHLLALEIASWQHIKDRDVAAMRSYLADDAVLIFGDGTRYTKSAYLAIIPDYDLVAYAVEKNSEIVMVSPDVAALLYKVTYTGGLKNAKPATATVSSVSTYARRNGAWSSVLYQETPAK
ncbi:MAG: nuclear transport factor 2 family protein [Alphaproteobacteria bacterium]|nr:nuclear transport factor 2 family protein [Alphaproteobacteria bacterium]